MNLVKSLILRAKEDLIGEKIEKEFINRFGIEYYLKLVKFNFI